MKREGQQPEMHVTTHSGIRCDRLHLFIAELPSFTAIINQSHQYLTELKGLTARGEEDFKSFVLSVLKK